MGDENPTSRKVCHGSLEREADESSRRRKHRHHRHHRHRSSRKHRDSDQSKKGLEEELRYPTVSSSKNVSVLEVASHQHDARADYDKEEGEIIEEDEVCDTIMTAHFRDGGDHDTSSAKVKIGVLFQNTEPQTVDLDFYKESQLCNVNMQNDGSAVEKNIRQKCEIDTCKKYKYQGFDTSLKHHKMSSTRYGDGHVACDSYDGVRKEHDVVVRIDDNCKIKSESIYGGSPKPHDSFNSWPHHPSGERSRSTSILQESVSVVYGDNGAVSPGSRQCMNGSGEEKITKRYETDGYRRDVIGRRESDRDGSCGAYYDHWDQKQSQMYWNREMEGRGAYEDQRRDSSHDRVRHMDSEKHEKPYNQRDRTWTRDQKTEGYNDREQEKQRDKFRADHYIRKPEKQPQLISDRSEDTNRKRHRERGGNVDDGRMEKHETINRGVSRDKASERERCREGDGERGRQKERFGDRIRVEYTSDVSIVYDGLNHSKHSSKSLRRDEIDKYGGRNAACDYQIEDASPYKRRGEVGSDEYGQGEVSGMLPTEDQEEEDLNRIKEESKRRREAILEKYKAKLVKQRTIPQQQNEGKNAEIQGDEFLVEKSPHLNGMDDIQRPCGTSGLGEGTPKSEVPHMTDMFCDDIFGESPEEVHKSRKGDDLPLERSGLHDNWDDAEGYYCYRFGELMDGRYEVTAAHGKGVFSTVVRAKDLKAGYGDLDEVAIKIIRNNETMYKAGMQELVILKKLVGADPDNRRHCVRFVSHFKYRNHLCLVFESLHMNLRDVLKKFGRNIGLKLTAVRAYSKQLFIALKHLRNCGVLHCDIKPDNMVVNGAKNVLKLCDFGNAMFSGKNELTPYLVSRFYRAPEIILGLSYDHPLDIWSIGCCIYEIYTGKVLFPGPTNNDMLRLHMELKGSFPKKMLRKGAFTEQHFDQDLNFHATEEDPVTKKTIKRLLLSIKPKDIAALIPNSAVEDQKMLTSFKDLLDKMFVLDPEKRITVSQALSHPFITDIPLLGICESFLFSKLLWSGGIQEQEVMLFPGDALHLDVFGEVCLSY